MTFKKAESWNGKNPWEWVKYDWNEPPEPQLVPFPDFVGVNIASVSKKTAVKYTQSVLIRNGLIRSTSEILGFFKKWLVEL